MVVNYYDTGYRFIDGMRFFKENDPYYYKVDNIPLKQLDENVKFLKDQTDGLLQLTSQKTTLGRDGFTELQPYVNATDSWVSVRPGRYTTRVNDAYNIDPMQFLELIEGEGSNIDGVVNRWKVGTVAHDFIKATMDKWHAKTTANATNMNGLYERAFVYPVSNLDDPGNLTNTSDPRTFAQQTGGYFSQAPFPALTGVQPVYDRLSPGHWIRGTEWELFAASLFHNTGRLETDFIRKWRGVTRTAIVDVPDDLSIEIPPFDSDDFFYIDNTGTRQEIVSAQRIDLLFIYSKPVDQSNTTIQSWTNGTARTINAPVLGIVKGAGIGLNQKLSTQGAATNSEEKVELQSLEGITLMLPNVSDEIASGTGFSTSAGTVKGSFPSPDDLMNLAPLLSEKLEADAAPLIGQTILPIAYIVVRGTAGSNAQGTPIITGDDIIDIRPLLRTTELAYNERAGIAAAIPQVSLANPVVTENYVESIKRDIVLDYGSKISSVNSRIVDHSRVVAAGTVKGGMYYGVEGALASYLRSYFNVTNFQQSKNTIESRYNYPTGSIPDLPDWDIAQWCENGTYSGKGTFPNDRIGYHQHGMNLGGAASTNVGLEFGPFSEKPSTTGGVPSLDPANNPKITRLGTDRLHAHGDNINNMNVSLGNNSQLYVSKTIFLDKSQITWAADYFVNVQLENCVPLSCRNFMSTTTNQQTSIAGSADIWVDRREDSFTIYVSWVAEDSTGFNGGEDHNEYQASRIPANNRNDGSQYAGFSVINKDIEYSANPNSLPAQPSSNAGVALYPTVSFQVVGIPQVSRDATANLNGSNPTIQLI